MWRGYVAGTLVQECRLCFGLSSEVGERGGRCVVFVVSLLGVHMPRLYSMGLRLIRMVLQ